MKLNTVILGIDIQNDFTTSGGRAFIKGADKDVIRMASFIDSFGSSIDYMLLALKSRQPIHISNQCYWKDREGYPPAIYTEITSAQVEVGDWTPQYNKSLTLDYLKVLESNDETCQIWPTHCVLGSHGWAFNPIFSKALYTWSVTNSKSYDLIFRGMSQITEHCSIFKANVEFEHIGETKFNDGLLNKLYDFDRIIVMGQSADYSVSRSIADLLEAAPALAERLIVLTDCMSWVNADNAKAKVWFQKAHDMGVTFTTTIEYAHC